MPPGLLRKFDRPLLKPPLALVLVGKLVAFALLGRLVFCLFFPPILPAFPGFPAARLLRKLRWPFDFSESFFFLGVARWGRARRCWSGLIILPYSVSLPVFIMRSMGRISQSSST